MTTGDGVQKTMIELTVQVRELAGEIRSMNARVVRIEQAIDGEKLLVRMDRNERDIARILLRLDEGDDVIARVAPIETRVHAVEQKAKTHEQEIGVFAKAQQEHDNRVKTLERESETRKWIQRLVIGTLVSNLFLIGKWVWSMAMASGGGP